MNNQLQPALVVGGPLLMRALRGIMLRNRAGRAR
jgi:hypothetical protein